MSQSLAQSKPLEYRGCTVPRVRRGDSGDAQGHLGIFERGELGKKMMELKHEPDVFVAEVRERLIAHRTDVGAANLDRSGIATVETAK
jgi:hypothetical protein